MDSQPSPPGYANRYLLSRKFDPAKIPKLSLYLLLLVHYRHCLRLVDFMVRPNGYGRTTIFLSTSSRCRSLWRHCDSRDHILESVLGRPKGFIRLCPKFKDWNHCRIGIGVCAYCGFVVHF